MNLNESGFEFLKKLEGCSLEAYQDSGGIWTVGYGSTQRVGPTTKITQREADEMLHGTVQSIEIAVAHLVKIEIDQNEFTALVCFAYNVGIHAFAHSTLLKVLNTGDKTGAAEQFLQWDKIKINGVPTVSLGLLRRREQERALFLTEC